jgi:hypothetical protein
MGLLAPPLNTTPAEEARIRERDEEERRQPEDEPRDLVPLPGRPSSIHSGRPLAGGVYGYRLPWEVSENEPAEA